jgi:MFS transporter, ACS family, tartrate transporter
MTETEIARGAMLKASWRILPLLGLGYLVAYMDRVNITFAALQMNADLGFSASVYGLGGGLFFLTVPCSRCLRTCSWRKWARGAGWRGS